MILIEFLFAPTVPSEPRPQKTRADYVIGLDVEIGIEVNARVRDVVDDAEEKWFFGLVAWTARRRRLDHRRREFLGGKAVATADDTRHGSTSALASARFCQRGDDVDVERFARRARLLGAIQHGDLLRSSRATPASKCFDREWAIQAHFDDAHLFALVDQVVDRLVAVSAPEPMKMMTRSASAAPT